MLIILYSQLFRYIISKHILIQQMRYQENYYIYDTD